jgi:hypothetical protein
VHERGRVAQLLGSTVSGISSLWCMNSTR